MVTKLEDLAISLAEGIESRANSGNQNYRDLMGLALNLDGLLGTQIDGRKLVSEEESRLPQYAAELLGMGGEHNTFSQIVAEQIYSEVSDRISQRIRLSTPAEAEKLEKVRKSLSAIDGSTAYAGVRNLARIGFGVEDIEFMVRRWPTCLKDASSVEKVDSKESFLIEREFDLDQRLKLYRGCPQFFSYNLGRISHSYDVVMEILKNIIPDGQIKEAMASYGPVFNLKVGERIAPRLRWAVENKPEKFKGTNFFHRLLIPSDSKFLKENHIDPKDFPKYF